MAAGVLRTVPLAGELTASVISRAADRYGLPAADVLRLWTCRNSPTRHGGGGVRADAEVVFNEAGRGVLAELCGVEPAVLARALPAFTVDDPKISTGREADLAQARWRAAGAVAGEAAFACRSCTARRTGQAQRAVRYLPRWQRVCVRHGRWLLDADADQPLEHLDLRGVLEVAAAQRRWPGVARCAVRAGVAPEQAFTVAHAVVARWWEQALHWEQEEIWPHRLHLLAGGNAGHPRSPARHRTPPQPRSRPPPVRLHPHPASTPQPRTAPPAPARRHRHSPRRHRPLAAPPARRAATAGLHRLHHPPPTTPTVPAWIHPAPDLPRAMICTRHQQAASDPRQRTPLDIHSLPELTRAHLAARRPPTAASLSWATTITTRWYDHHQHLHTRWQKRLHQLTTANPHLAQGPASPTLTSRNLITYPETLTLATALDRLPPHPQTRTEQTAFLHQLASRLQLPRLAPADHDLLRQRLTTR
ncbi:TniQ family protein [Streptomyces violaceusniger]|uniref:TniQ family protein n=1 Tax=Streptomyces violaceusniger TaxID=68280 RepID=UPI00343A675C